MTVSVAFQGERGAFSEAAAIKYFGDGVKSVPLPSFEEVFAAVHDGQCTYGLVPIENSLAGSIHRNYDLLVRHNLHIVGEVNLRIVHCLIVNPGVTLKDIKRVYSHPQALAQCEGSIVQLGAEPFPTYDTAGAVRFIKEQAITDGAAIASRQAAVDWEMDVLQEGMEDWGENLTRFLVLSPKEEVPESDAKTSIVFAMKDVPGALFKALSVFALREINLTKIESRPLRGQPWQYLFYLDFEGTMAEERCQRAIGHLGEITSYFRLLGSYSAATE